MIFSLVVALVLLLMAAFSFRRQFGILRMVRHNQHMASDDRHYLRNQAYRRLLSSVLMMALAGMLAGAYLSGMDRRLDELGERKNAEQPPAQPLAKPGEREFARFSIFYWMGILLLLFLIVSIAIVDLWATRRYGWDQLRRIQNESRAMLERDLAMHRQQKLNDRMRKVE